MQNNISSDENTVIQMFAERVAQRCWSLEFLHHPIFSAGLRPYLGSIKKKDKKIKKKKEE